ncbi:hypothetical protein [Nitrospirillum amazonense]|uniref:hypothetical protein n=1 Tax=Nitrospirillum amazonense TaxID=28077 RepID=UPI001645B412|nr:hypothetical protein [Nitrospirillum amazonense]
MTTDTTQIHSWRKPSPGYYASLGFALVGIVFGATAVGGSLDIRAQEDAFNAINGVGLPALIFVWFLLYAFRLIFWGRIPRHYQNLTRTVLSLIMCGEVLLTAYALFLVSTQPRGDIVGGESSSIIILWFTILATLCQIGTIIWLVRYRKE